MSESSYIIHNDVLLTESKVAFLAGGNHSVIDYITEKKKPTNASISNFGKNIASRAYIANICKSKYLHVIFPDKQSVLQEEFPLKNTVQLGEIYTNSIASTSLKNLVLFPTQELRAAAEFETFQKLDTHLSDNGSLVVLREIVRRLHEDAQTELDELQSLITVKQTNNGDLGSKFTPKLTQESTLLKTNWNYQHYSSGGTFNNGQIDIYLSPSAPIQKKLLIFGDSFYRLMLTQFSRLFREVIFLRTPYLHAEMVQLIKPEIILTGNAERYLANVASDIDAPAFQIYAYAHNSESKPSASFINAFRAVTSPTSATSKTYLNNVFNETSQRKVIFGPSHIVRWGQHLKHNLLNRPIKSEDLVGYGGAPVWSKRLFDSAESNSSHGNLFLLMVGDFRFGNEICLKPERNSLPLFTPNLSGINAKAINPENDAYMLNRCVNALDAWSKKFNGGIRFIFWDLFCRQVQDRLARNHIHDKQYLHPCWNLAPLQSTLPKEQVIDLAPLLRLPMHEVMRLFIDGSSHPSYIGYQFILNCFIHGSGAMTAYNKAVHDVEKWIFNSVKNLVKRKNAPLIICGQSVWLDTLMRYLGPSGTVKAKSLGLALIPFNPQLGYSAGAIELTLGENVETVIITDNGAFEDLPARFQTLINDGELTRPASSHVAWEARCQEIIHARNETPRSLHGTLVAVSSCARQVEVSDADVELGPYGYPTISGIIKLLDFM